MTEYYYGMKARGYSPWCQPMDGLHRVLLNGVEHRPLYHDVLVYDRELTEEEVKQYDLELFMVGKGGDVEQVR